MSDPTRRPINLRLTDQAYDMLGRPPVELPATVVELLAAATAHAAASIERGWPGDVPWDSVRGDAMRLGITAGIHGMWRALADRGAAATPTRQPHLEVVRDSEAP